MIRSVTIIILFLITATSGLNGQECAVKLREAEASFNEGRVEEVPGLLEECLRSGFTREEELSAYMLIIRSYLFDDKTELAEQTMLEFLRKRPEYEVSPTDNADFVYLLKQFRVKPVIQIGVHGGGNIAYITGLGTTENQNSVSSLPSDRSYSNDQITMTLGLDVRFRIDQHFEVGLEADYSEITFRSVENIMDFSLSDYLEEQTRVEASAMGYYVPKILGRFYPYVKLGAGAGYNFTSNVTRVTGVVDVNNVGKRTGPIEDRVEYRNPLDVFIHPGIGLKFKLPSSYIFIDASTRISFIYQSKPQEPGNDGYYYMHTDDWFRLNTLRLNAGFIYIFYKPEKLKE